MLFIVNRWLLQVLNPDVDINLETNCQHLPNKNGRLVWQVRGARVQCYLKRSLAGRITSSGRLGESLQNRYVLGRRPPPLPLPSETSHFLWQTWHENEAYTFTWFAKNCNFFIFLNTLDKLYHHVLCPWSLKVSGWGGILWNIFGGSRKFCLTYWYMSVIIENQNSLLCLCKNIQSC